MVRDALELLYVGRCTVYETKSERNPINKRIETVETIAYQDIPCRLSYTSKNSAYQTDTFAQVSQNIKLFVSPDLSIFAGSKILVNQHGRTNLFKASGEPAVYSHHQEIPLMIGDDKA